jgi:anaerobic selenocysteine-containing dehydrogenase
MPTTIARTCNVCEAMCGMLVTVDDGAITDIRGDAEDPFSRGHICPKGPAMRELQEDPDRLRRPVRRTATGWQEIGWDEAIDECATRLRAIRERHGRDAIGAYIGNPSVHNHGAAIMLQGFLRSLGSKNRFDANSMDANPKLFSSMMMFGEATSIPVPDVDRTDYMLVLGANPAASNGSLMSLGDVRGRMKAIRDRGGKLIVLDPRRTESVAWADEHHFIRPGGDAAFLWGVLHTLFTESLVDLAAARRQADGVDEMVRLAQRFAPERVASACGVPAETIRRLARDFAGARRAVCYGRVGTSVNEFGCEASWLIDVVNLVTGNLDREGGAMFTTPAIDLGRLGRVFDLSRWNRWKSRVRGLPEFGGQLPVAAMAEEMDTPGEGQIRGFVTVAGNPVLSAPNAGRLERALAGLEFMVSLDFYINETSRHAHIILPARYALERAHVDVVLEAFAVRNKAKYSPKVVEPAPDTREDWEILYDLGMRLGEMHFGHPVVNRAAKLAWKRGLKLSPDFIVDLGIRIGPHGDRFIPGSKGLNLKKIKAQPHGVDLGPLKPQWKERVRTRTGRADLAPAPLVAQTGRLEAWIGERTTAQARGELQLIGRRHVRTNNSWMHNCHSLTKGPDRSALLMNPADAARLRLEGGAVVRIKSRVGEVHAKLELSDAIMPGVVSLPHGFGHEAAKDTMRIAGALPGPNINALTDESLVEPIIGTAVLNGVPVVVEAVAAAGARVAAAGA